MQKQGWWTDDEEGQLRGDVRTQVLNALKAAEAKDRPHQHTLFDDVYDELTPALQKQKDELDAYLAAKN